ncbi:MAG: NF038143 family protein [Desulfobulbales bacterium]|nr:NF038143 family protein [Desulfobulbales bacterium]
MRCICDHERRCAEILAARVLQKPQMHIWMILIPIIFVFYLNDLKKYKDGRDAFVENYLTTRKRALEEAAAIIKEGRDSQLDSLVLQMPEEARQALKNLLAILVEHYRSLLMTTGQDYKGLVRSMYENFNSYSSFIDRLDAAERALNRRLRPDLEKSEEGVADIFSAIEQSSREIQQAAAREFFT